MFTCYIAVSVLEDEDGSFVDLESEVGLGRRQRMVYVSLDCSTGNINNNFEDNYWVRKRNGCTDFFSRANASIDLVDDFPANHFVEDDPGTRVQNLLVGGSVRLVFEIGMLARTLAVYTNAEVIRLVDLGYPRGKF